MIDRTAEFQGCIRVLHQHDGRPDQRPQYEAPQPTDFTKAVSALALSLEGTAKLIEQLMRLVGRKGTSNDPTMEITDVSRLFKGDMDAVQQELSALQAFIDGRSGKRGAPAPGSQRHKHSLYMLDALKQLAQEQVAAFQAALKQRNAVMRELNDRRKVYSTTRSVGLSVQMNSPLFGHHAVASKGHASPAGPAAAFNASPGQARSGSLPGQGPRPQPPPSSYNGAHQHQPSQQRQPDAEAVAMRQRPFASPPLRPPPPWASPAGHADSSPYVGKSPPPPLLPPPPPQQHPTPPLPLPYPAAAGGATSTPPPSQAQPNSGGGGSMGLRRRAAGGGDAGGAVVAGNAAWQVQELERHSTNRLDEARKVESMIGELGHMFSKFSALVAAQEETVVHIEDDVEMAHGFAVDGHAHLSRYYQTISGNRGIIVKVLILLAFFVWVFTIAF